MSDLTRNPDILTCLANISNDEVFTPPEIASAMLDLIPEDFWKDPNVKVFDPSCKSGVFLREAAKRFLKGEEEIIPDLKERIDHIFHKQLFGHAVTELTSHLSRRTVYCSKTADGKYSVTKFKSKRGNIAFSRIVHTWEDGKCKYCGASQEVFDRGEEAETHAYQFIHLTSQQIKELDMKFDLIIGNPPYQLDDGGAGASAKPIYQLFIQQAKKLKPRYLSMITPSRWFSGGKDLDAFRQETLHDDRMCIIHDFLNGGECFPGVDIKGGVNYFLWSRDYHGPCKIVTHENNKIVSEMLRPLLEPNCDVFIRYNESISILRKIQKFEETSFSQKVNSAMFFGFRTYFNEFESSNPAEGLVKVYANHAQGYIKRSRVVKNTDCIDKWKVIVPEGVGSGDSKTDRIKPILCPPGTINTETYVMNGPWENQKEAENVISYIQTKFFHFLLGLKKLTQHTTNKVYELIPMQDFSKPWTDVELYEKYKLSKDEIAFIENSVWPKE